MLKNIFTRFFLLLLPLFAFSYHAEAATLHALLVGDTLEGEISTGTECSIDLMHRQIRRIAAFTEQKLSVSIFEGYHVTQQNIFNYINQMIVEPDDMIMICFFMHGSRDSEKLSKWPDLHFPFEQSKPDFGAFIQTLEAKQPRFLFALADSCNAIRIQISDDDDEEEDEEIDESLLIDFLAKKGPSTHYFIEHLKDHIIDTEEDETAEKYRKLFLEMPGSLRISSAIPGQSAYRNPITGGVYTKKFLEAFRHMLWAEKTNWEDILDFAAMKVYTKQNPVQTRQTPQYEIHLK